MSNRGKNRPRKRMNVRDAMGRWELTPAERVYLGKAVTPPEAEVRKTTRAHWTNPFHEGLQEVRRGPIRNMAKDGSPHWAEVASDNWQQMKEDMKRKIQRCAELARVKADNTPKSGQARYK